MLLAGTTPCFISEFMVETMACSLTSSDPPYLRLPGGDGSLGSGGRARRLVLVERTHVVRGMRGEPCHLRHDAANARALRRRTHHHHRPDRPCGIAGANDPPVDRTRTRIKNRLRGDCAPTSQERPCRSASKRKLSPSIPYARGEGDLLGHFSARSSRNDRLSHSKKVTPTSAILG